MSPIPLPGRLSAVGRVLLTVLLVLFGPPSLAGQPLVPDLSLSPTPRFHSSSSKKPSLAFSTTVGQNIVSANLTNSLAPFRVFLRHGPVRSTPPEPPARQPAGETQKEPAEFGGTSMCRIQPGFQRADTAAPSPPPFTNQASGPLDDAGDWWRETEKIRAQVAALIFREQFVLQPPADQFQLLESVFDLECLSPQPSFRQRQVMAARTDFTADDIGLALEASAENTSGRAVDDGRSAWAGLSWDLLNEGLRENRIRARRLTLRQAIATLKAQRRRQAELYECRDDALLRYFMLLRQQELEKRQQVLRHFRTLLRQAYFTGEVLLDELIRIEAALFKVNTSLESTAMLADRLPDGLPSANQPPSLLALDLDQLQRAAGNRTRDELIARFEDELIDLEYDPLNDVTLRLYARTGIVADNGDDYAAADRVAFGIRFRAPITFRDYEHLRRQEKRSRAEALALERQRRILELVRRANAYQEKLKDAYNLLLTRQIIVERLRRSLLLLDESPDRPNLHIYRDLLQQLDEYHDNAVEFLAAEEALYRRLLLLFTDIGIDPEPSFFSSDVARPPYARARLGQRAAYLWSAAVNTSNPDDIVWFCVTKGIDHLLVSLGGKTDRTRFAELLARCRTQRIDVVPVASTTAWLDPDNRRAIQRFFDDLPEDTTLVHLDIEPQTRADFSERRAAYHRQYVAMLAWIAAHKPAGLGIDIAVPVWWTPDEIRAVLPYADSLTVMAYGTDDPDRCRQRLFPFADIDPRRITIALRPKDFQDEAGLEQFIDRLVDQSPYRRFAFHDLPHYITLTGDTAL